MVKTGDDKMIKCEVIEQFTLKRFDELKNIQRKSIEVKGRLFVDDTFECDEDMVKYLMGDNKDNKVVVKVIEVEPEKTIEERIEDIRNIDIEEPITKEKFEKLKKEFELKPKKKKSSKK